MPSADGVAGATPRDEASASPEGRKGAASSKGKASPVLPGAAAVATGHSDVLPTAKTVTDEVPFDWYVIRVQSGREDTLSSKILKKLKLAGHDHFVRSVVVPKQKISEVRDGKKRVREMKLYPGYFFMEMQLVEEIWYLLRDTPGVGDFVGGGAKPIPMTATEVKRLLDVLEERERDEPPEIKIEVDKNDTVKIKEGPFENFEGVVEEVHPAKGQVRVMVTIFGRETPVDLEYWQVEKV
jgi:transcriptional antiterminator NusG